ncbi:MAG: hypothetical protein U1D30_03460 [Planctomycetota bacterium]
MATSTPGAFNATLPLLRFLPGRLPEETTVNADHTHDRTRGFGPILSRDPRKLLEIGASLDRMDRAGGAERTANDPRRVKIEEALRLLQNPSSGRAEAIQRLFSRGYDPSWIEGFEPAERLARQGS